MTNHGCDLVESAYEVAETETVVVPAEAWTPRAGFFEGIGNETYHAGPGISKSGLWTIATRSPAHYKFPAPKVETPQSKAAKDIGTAIHCAILEPNEFEKRIFRGPDDRRGNKWKDAEAFCQTNGALLLVADDYDHALMARDVVHGDAYINSIITGGKAVVEGSAYWEDADTGLLCKCRPDLYRPDIGVVVDLKSTKNARNTDFARDVVNYGYHAQEAWYSAGMMKAGLPIGGFLFLAVEKEQPFGFKLYELPPSIVEEGAAIMSKAFATYAECVARSEWPTYGDGVEELTFPRWAYKNTGAPDCVTDEWA